jgi:hypothetical protein
MSWDPYVAVKRPVRDPNDTPSSEYVAKIHGDVFVALYLNLSKLYVGCIVLDYDYYDDDDYYY